MEWKTAKQIAAELGVTQSAVYEGIKRGGRVGGETLEKGGPGGRRYRIKAEKPRIPKPPLTIKEEPSELDGDVWARFEKLEKLIYDLTEGERVKRTIATDSIKQRLESIGETLSVHSREFDTQDTKIKHRTLTSDARLTDLHERMKKLEKTDEKRENFDIRSYLDSKVKEHVEMMIKATFELPDHGSDIERLGDRIDRVSDKLTERLDLWASKLEHVDRSVSEYVDRELTRRFDVEPWKNPDGEIEEIKSRIAKLQDRLAEATKNGGEYRNQVNERLDLQHKIQCQQLTSMKELKEHAQDNVERIIFLEKWQEYIEGTLKTFNWDGFDGRPKRGEIIGLIRGGVQEELKRIGKQEDNQSKAILNDIGRLFKRVVDLESTRALDEEFKRDTNRSIQTIEQNIRTLLGLDSAKKAPSAADIMKRTVKAASAFADAMKGDA